MIITNFNLTKCKKLTIRRRTLAGTTSYYYTYFEPKGLDKHSRRFAIDSFKHPQTKEDRKTSDKMIDYAIVEFLKQHDINEFDTIIGLPSSSKVVTTIVNNLINRGFKGYIQYKGFVKTRIRNVKLKKHIIDHEGSLKTKEKVPEAYKHIRKLHYDKVARVSLFPTRFRRYFENFLSLNVNNINCLKNKTVLVVDDTFGEGLTMCEVCRILKPYTNNVIGFTIMKDYAK